MHQHYYYFLGTEYARGGGRIFKATSEWGSTKYGGSSSGGLVLGNTGLSGPEQQQLRELYSFGLAKETWSSYRTAERMLLRCCREKNQKLELPLGEETI